MSIKALSKTELKHLRQIIANHIETMTCGELSEHTLCRLWLIPPSGWNGWKFSVRSYYGPADNLPMCPAAPTPTRPVLLCDIRERKDESSLLNQKVAEAKASLKAAGLLPAGSRFAA